PNFAARTAPLAHWTAAMPCAERSRTVPYRYGRRSQRAAQTTDPSFLIISVLIERRTGEKVFGYSLDHTAMDAGGRGVSGRCRRVLRVSPARHLRLSLQHFDCQCLFE